MIVLRRPGPAETSKADTAVFRLVSQQVINFGFARLDGPDCGEVICWSPGRWWSVQGARDVGHLQVEQGGGLELRGDPPD